MYTIYTETFVCIKLLEFYKRDPYGCKLSYNLENIVNTICTHFFSRIIPERLIDIDKYRHKRSP